MANAELGVGYVTIAPSMKGFASKLKSGMQKSVKSASSGVSSQFGGIMEGAGLESAGKFSNVFVSGMKSAFSVVSKAAVTTAAAMSAAFVAVGTAAVTGFSDYEQMVGGVQKLFSSDDMGDATMVVLDRANAAWKTAGMSANDYMENVTSVAASLKQSMGGDVYAAADAADKMIIDAADNANTFGTDLDSVMYAYKGFAKQNFTMLDNLKLGKRIVATAEYKPREFGETLRAA